MSDPISYSLEHANGTVDLTLTDRRFIVKTKGVGLIDKLRTIDIPVTDVEKFALVPTIAAQNVVGATGATMVYDESYDAEFIFSYRENGKLQRKRVFVNRENEAFARLLDDLKQLRPSASLLDLDPAVAQKQIGVMSGSKALYILVAVIVGIPLVVGLIVMLTRSHA